jgi:hypothetical protein
LLLGDILDPLHSTLWLDKSPGEPGYVRPWTDIHAPEYAAKVQAITQAILKYNAEAIETLRHITEGQFVRLLLATSRGRAALNGKEQVTVPVRIHYMIGNHDRYYHIHGQTFDRIRQGIIQALGLVNPNSPFPYEVKIGNAPAIIRQLQDLRPTRRPV